MTKTFTLVRAATLALVATGFVSLAPLAHAADDAPVPQAEINIAGTDFTSAKAVDHLIIRLHHVALDICVPDSDQKSTLGDDQRTCVQTVLKSGLAQIETRRQQAMRDSTARLATAAH